MRTKGGGECVYRCIGRGVVRLPGATQHPGEGGEQDERIQVEAVEALVKVDERWEEDKEIYEEIGLDWVR